MSFSRSANGTAPTGPAQESGNLSPRDIVIVVTGFLVASMWPFGPLVIAAILSRSLFRDRRRRLRRIIVLAGLFFSVVEIVSVAALFITGGAGRFMFSVH